MFSGHYFPAWIFIILFTCVFTHTSSHPVLSPVLLGFVIDQTQGLAITGDHVHSLALPCIYLHHTHIILPFLGIHWNPCCSLWTPDKGTSWHMEGRKQLCMSRITKCRRTLNVECPEQSQSLLNLPPGGWGAAFLTPSSAPYLSKQHCSAQFNGAAWVMLRNKRVGGRFIASEEPRISTALIGPGPLGWES